MYNIIKFFDKAKKVFILEKNNCYNYSVISTNKLKKGLVGGLSKKLRNEINENIDELELKSLRERNHNKYYQIKINNLKKISEYYPKETKEIIEEYEQINSLQLLEDDYHDVMKHYQILKHIEKVSFALETRIKKNLGKLINSNDVREKEIKIDSINNYDPEDEGLVRKIKNKYESLKLYNMSSDLRDIVFEYERQLVRKGYITEIEQLYEEFQAKKTSRDYDKKLLAINLKIKEYILGYQRKVEELRRQISRNDPNYSEFKEFVDYYMNLIHYDNTNLLKAKRQLELLEFNTIFQLNYEKLKKSIDKSNNDNELYYEKISKRIFNDCLISIRNNYILLFSSKIRNQIIEKLKELNEIEVMSSSIRKEYESFLKPLIIKIWKMSITNIIKYKSGDKFKFICCPDRRENNKYYSMLITDKEISLVNDLGNFQSGYIYPYKNVIEITTNKNIDNDSHNPFSYLVTPEQLESDFVYNKKSNRIIQDSYYLDPLALYFIDNGTEIPEELLKKAINEGLDIIKISINDYKG